MQHIQQPTNKITNSFSNIYAIGGDLAIILIALGIIAKRFIKSHEQEKVEEEKSEQDLIETLKEEIEKRDKLIARLTNELITVRKALEFSGDFSPPVTEKRVNEVKQSVNSELYDRTDT